jgi:hypothetical protein
MIQIPNYTNGGTTLTVRKLSRMITKAMNEAPDEYGD